MEENAAREPAAEKPFCLPGLEPLAPEEPHGLPDGSVLELMTHLRATSAIRGIAISGFGMNGDVEKSLQAGFAEHLVKPVNLEAAIEHVMSASG